MKHISEPIDYKVKKLYVVYEPSNERYNRILGLFESLKQARAAIHQLYQENKGKYKFIVGSTVFLANLMVAEIRINQCSFDLSNYPLMDDEK